MVPEWLDPRKYVAHINQLNAGPLFRALPRGKKVEEIAWQTLDCVLYYGMLNQDDFRDMMPDSREMYEEDAINVRGEKLDEVLPWWMSRDGDTLDISDKD